MNTRKTRKRMKVWNPANLRNNPAFYWSLAVLYALCIFLLSADPKPPEPSAMLGVEIPNVDKIFHFFIYAVFGIILYVASEKSDFSPETSTHLSIALGSIYAFTDEVHQSFVPGRSSDPLDFLVDVVGILAGIAFYIWRWRKV